MHAERPAASASLPVLTLTVRLCVRYPTMWQVISFAGGQTTLRQSWSSYYRDTAAVIMMVDSTDRARVGLVKEELFKLLGSEALDPKGVLVLANKQDLPDAMTAAELSEALSLHDIKGKEWHIQASCALTGEGLWEGLEWVAARCSGAG